MESFVDVRMAIASGFATLCIGVIGAYALCRFVRNRFLPANLPRIDFFTIGLLAFFSSTLLFWQIASLTVELVDGGSLTVDDLKTMAVQIALTGFMLGSWIIVRGVILPKWDSNKSAHRLT